MDGSIFACKPLLVIRLSVVEERKNLLLPLTLPVVACSCSTPETTTTLFEVVVAARKRVAAAAAAVAV